MKKSYLVIFMLIIALSAAAVYFNSLKTPFVYDDSYILQNPGLKSLNAFFSNILKFDRPLTFFTFAVNYSISKTQTYGYHLFNLAIHILACLAVFLLIYRIFMLSGYDDAIIPAFALSLLFALHPLNTESVTYIYNRSSSMSTLFYLLSLLSFTFIRPNNFSAFIITVVFFIFSFLSKEISVTIPLVIILFDYIFLSNFSMEELRKRTRYHAILWGMLILMLIIGLLITNTPANESPEAQAFRKIPYLLTQAWSMIKFLIMLIVPAGQAIDHNISTVSILDLRMPAILLFLVISISAIIYLLKKNKHSTKIAAFGILWYLITFMPTILPRVQIGERHVYLPEFGFLLIIGSLLCYLNENKTKIPWKNLLLAVLLIVSVFFGFLTNKRNKIYADPVILWTDVLNRYPNDYKAFYNRANAYYKNGEYDKAINDYTTVINALPYKPEPYINRILCYQTKGDSYFAFKFADEFVNLYPDTPISYFTRANLYFYDKKYDNAIVDYSRALSMEPDFIEGYYSRGIAYYRNKSYQSAISDFNVLIERRPDNAFGYCWRGLSYFFMKNREMADKDFKRAISLNPETKTTIDAETNKLEPQVHTDTHR